MWCVVIVLRSSMFCLALFKYSMSSPRLIDSCCSQWKEYILARQCHYPIALFQMVFKEQVHHVAGGLAVPHSKMGMLSLQASPFQVWLLPPKMIALCRARQLAPIQQSPSPTYTLLKGPSSCTANTCLLVRHHSTYVSFQWNWPRQGSARWSLWQWGQVSSTIMWMVLVAMVAKPWSSRTKTQSQRWENERAELWRK